jgi:thiamine kinase-like enzyme
VEPSSGRVCAIDWEMAGIGAGMLDLAALVSGGWRDDERTAMALAYRESLPGHDRPPEDRFLLDLDACLLHVCIQWLGWSPGWEPPPEHRHDWLAHAVELADRLAVAA